METVAVTERQMGKMEVAELKMVRWALEVTRKDKIRNKYVRGTAKIAKLGDKLRNARLRWYGHVKRREDYVGKRMMEMAVPGRRKRGRPRRRWMDLVREDMERRRSRSSEMEITVALWRPQVGRSRKKKKKSINESFKNLYLRPVAVQINVWLKDILNLFKSKKKWAKNFSIGC